MVTVMSVLILTAAIEGHPNGVITNIVHIPFSDKSFGATFASHLLEHLPTADDANEALAELNRVAEAVFIVCPSRQSVVAWLISGHHLWIWQRGNRTYIRQRGRPANGKREDILIETARETPRNEGDSSKVKSTAMQLENADRLVFLEEARRLAQQLFGNKIEKCAAFTNRLLDIRARTEGKDFLLIHNPGGWGSTPLERCLRWERSVVEGISTTMGRLGRSWLLTQYFRCGNSWWAHMWDVKEQTRFFFKGESSKVRVMAAELKFIAQHIKNLKVILIGASQGAAFSNAVMRQLDGLHQVYSIELGIFFPHMPRRVVTERTLAIDTNGVMPDPMAHRDLWAGSRAYISAPFRWIKYQLQGKPEKFTYCINAPGHDYNWEYSAVRQQVVDFLETNFSIKSDLQEVRYEAGEIY